MYPPHIFEDPSCTESHTPCLGASPVFVKPLIYPDVSYPSKVNCFINSLEKSEAFFASELVYHTSTFPLGASFKKALKVAFSGSPNFQEASFISRLIILFSYIPELTLSKTAAANTRIGIAHDLICLKIALRFSLPDAFFTRSLFSG